MSRASGEVLSREFEGVLHHYIYNGTTDMVLPDTYDTRDEAWEAYCKAWDAEDYTPGECACGKPPKTVWLYADYGKGFHWEGLWCPDCRVIVGGLTPWDAEGGPADGRPYGEEPETELLEPETELLKPLKPTGAQYIWDVTIIVGRVQTG